MKIYNFENVLAIHTIRKRVLIDSSNYDYITFYYIDMLGEDGITIERRKVSDFEDNKIVGIKINHSKAPIQNLIKYKMLTIKKFYETDRVRFYDTFKEAYGVEWEIVNGIKYPKGTRFINNYHFKYYTKDRVKGYVDYLCDSERKIKVSMDNCKICGLGNLTLEEAYKKCPILKIEVLNNK